MRFDIHKVRAYLVNELLAATQTVADVRDDGTDLILADLRSGEAIIIYLIERVMPVAEIIETMTENTQKGLYTLFVLWGDMLLPEEGSVYLPDDWMETLYSLYGGKIYGYDSYGPFTSVFPVYFEDQGGGFNRFIRYGDAITAAHLHAETVRTDNRFISGFWQVADFEDRDQPQNGTGQRTALRPDRNTMEAYYARLTVARDADRETIRRAYRDLARQFHPDLNDSPEAKEQMQQINEAYKRIMQQLGDS